jgi:hypothetical protein
MSRASRVAANPGPTKGHPLRAGLCHATATVSGVSGQTWRFDNDRDGYGFGGLDHVAAGTFSD